MEKTASIWHFFIPRHFWKNVFLTPLYWLFLCFFQPVRFSEQFEYRTIAGRFTLIVRLALPLFFLIFLVALPVQGLLLCTTSCTLLSIFTWNTLSTIFIVTLFGATSGLLIGVLDNVGLGIILSITLGVTGIVMGDAGRGAARGMVIAVVIGLVTGTVKGVKWGIRRGILAGVLGGSAWTIGSIPVIGAIDITRGATVASIFFACYMIGYYRVPLYLVSGLSGLRAYIASKRNSTTVFLNLHNSSLYWDECVFFPLPLLRQTLLIAVRQNMQQALHEIAFIAKQRPQQIHAAQMTAIEIALRDLQSRETIRDIARASQRLNEIFPQDVMLNVSGSIKPFTHLIAVSLEAERYTGPFNWQTKREALETMRSTLDRIHPDTAFPNAQLNMLLADIKTRWRSAIRYQQEKLEEGGEGTGQIINPYNPGVPLKPQDTLFVGRRDVVRQLSESSSKPDRPTFLLNGERRMGKSSTLRQLPHLLGSSYIPVLYDLQVRSISSSIEAFLTKMAEEIYKTTLLRGIHIEQLEHSRLHNALQKNESYLPTL